MKGNRKVCGFSGRMKEREKKLNINDILFQFGKSMRSL
jgi:hypothetical protein